MIWFDNEKEFISNDLYDRFGILNQRFSVEAHQ